MSKSTIERVVHELTRRGAMITMTGRIRPSDHMIAVAIVLFILLVAGIIVALAFLIGLMIK